MVKAAVIGAGLGGLSAAIMLRSAGFEVTVIEKNFHAGGKLMPVSLGDYHFDFGPNTITMPHVFSSVFEKAGVVMEDVLEFIKLPHHTKNFSPDGTELVFSHDSDYMKKQLKEQDPFGAENYDKFLKEIERLYRLSEAHFFPKMFKGPLDYLSPRLGAAFSQVRPLETMDHFFRRYFKSPNVLQALNRYATYIGSSPYVSPATFAMIAYLELVQGVYYVKGGNVKIAEALQRAASDMGVSFLMGSEVVSIQVKEKRAESLTLDSGEVIKADEFIMNADLLKAFPELVQEDDRPHFSDQKRDRYEPSISAFVILAGMNNISKKLHHHNVFFSSNYQREFHDLFKNGVYSTQPTIYISSSSYTDRQQSVNGDNLFILVNAPPLKKDGRLQVNPEEYKELIYDRLEAAGLPIREHLSVEKVITPQEIAAKFGAYRGALYGISANRKLDAFLRPGNFSRDIKNLSFAGGSTHPGGGSPMVTISGMNVAKALIKRHQ
ncbi:phytoene desaturase [Metabacillus sp. GX 13764]|uniref:phytoene desaturase family protein n=1 Tax=Metabacillus kandeliae TaxID=2900151 RepID=UPI001E2D1C53|nr:phytoene desaturase [Metabacillus kandeliae]